MVNFHSYVSLPEGNGFGKAASPDEDTSKKQLRFMNVHLTKVWYESQVTHPHISTNDTSSSASQIPFLLFESPKNITNISIDPSLFQGSSIPVPRIFRCAFKCCQPKYAPQQEQPGTSNCTWPCSRGSRETTTIRQALGLIQHLFFQHYAMLMLCYFGSYSSI